MKVLICGAGKGSWEMRGHQIGAALGARVTSDPRESDWRWADVVILVKKHAVTHAPMAHRSRVPVIWDVLDCWSQPRDNAWSVADGQRYIARLAKTIKPVAMIAATQQMATDIGGVYIPHHCRIGLVPTPIGDRVRRVAYDGSERYLGEWQSRLRAACERRGWEFLINPASLVQVDILVALRDGQWDGPICRAWKSGVKYVNAICAGRPIVTQSAAACQELDPFAKFVEHPDDLSGALELCAAYDFRYEAAADRRGEQFTVEAIVETHYRPLLQRVLTEASCAA